jgi:hypoxanthine-DNA glycosylase
MILRGFAPLADADARVLVLGSLPGAESLRRGQYYAQPRNAFWWILGALADAGPEHPYPVRTARLQAAGIALWDVCAAARREGSLDAAIERDSVEVNDFAAFYARHPRLRRVCFNGRTAASLYRRHVLPSLDAGLQALERIELPSTSAAHAALTATAKLAAWRLALVPPQDGRAGRRDPA